MKSEFNSNLLQGIIDNCEIGDVIVAGEEAFEIGKFKEEGAAIVVGLEEDVADTLIEEKEGKLLVMFYISGVELGGLVEEQVSKYED